MWQVNTLQLTLREPYHAKDAIAIRNTRCYLGRVCWNKYIKYRSCFIAPRLS
jgi:hypothetical protein